MTPSRTRLTGDALALALTHHHQQQPNFLGRDVSLSMFGIECKEPFALDPQIEIHFE